MSDEPRVEVIPIADILPDDDNANKGTPRGEYMMDLSFRQYGAGRSILIDKNRRIAAGNKSHAKAGEIGIEEVIVVHTTGRQLVAVQRDDVDLDTPAGRALAIADNRTGEVNLDWDAETLLRQAEQGVPVQDMWHDDEWRELLGELAPEQDGAEDPGAQTDKAEELRAKWQTARGQLWLIGKHRLLCGDSTVPDDVARLMGGATVDMLLTDPPYCSGGFQEAGRSSGSIGTKRMGADGKEYAPKIANDTLSTRGYQALIKEVLGRWEPSFCYVFTDWRMWVPLFDCMESSGFGVRNMIVWDKGSPGMGRGWRTQHELVMFAVRADPAFDNHKAVGNVVRANRTGNVNHPTEKPVEVLATILGLMDFCQTVGDPFLGSGSTMVAAEQTNRACYGMELGPGFVAVALERLAQMGLEPRLSGLPASKPGILGDI